MVAGHAQEPFGGPGRDAGPLVCQRVNVKNDALILSPRKPVRTLVPAILIALLIASLNYGLWAYFNRPLVAPAEFDGRVRGMAYSAFQRHQSPLENRYPSEAEVAADLRLLARHTERIRIYTATENPMLPRLAREAGLKVTAGAWLSRDRERNLREINALVSAARIHRHLDRAIIGNETLLRGDLGVKELVGYLKAAKRRLKIPVSTAEPWHVWLKYPELARHVDFITVHLLPYWEGVPVEAAVEFVFLRLEELRRKFPNKPIVIGEVGWPSHGDRVRQALASTAHQAQFVRAFLARARDLPLEYYLMEAFDQPWKGAEEGRAGAYWGLFHADRTPKFPLRGPITEDAHWPEKALAASLLAFPFMLWFAAAFRRFRLSGRLFFAGLIQAAAALLVWLVAMPFEFYLKPLDWAMLALLAPAFLAMAAILLANGFEFTEALWRERWQRSFGPRELAPEQAQPFVSIHLACCNEPPEMVILTLNSLAHLDYQNFEVLVIDNNTRDEALWKPVAAWCEKAGPRFRFFHLPQWPGFKAGALNFALQQTDPRAEVVGVVDADYAVSRTWLSALIGHFLEPQVAVVQAPQAHRDFESNFFQRMCNWEFEGFFRVGMHHRNERNAIIQHGTMTLIRRSALERVGGWAEWCICEDAELGLRLMRAGYETRYVDRVLGRGLTPADFKAFKAQRLRWAFGAMQILKGHWSALTGKSPLSAGQRYHFLTGWFSWFADALHFAFALTSLLWTIGMLAAPKHFTLPLDLFLIPVLAFFAAKALFGPVLYVARVDCGWRDILGASLASMALSHAIARGVFQGLIQKRGVFVRTAKSFHNRGRFAAILGVVREELLMLVALSLGAGLTLWGLGGEREASLWAAILAAQAVPYGAALLTATISARAGRTARQGAQPTPEGAPVGRIEPAGPVRERAQA